MFGHCLDPAARDVLRHYSFLGLETRLTALGNHGGFSGACLWRVEAEGLTCCLRAWPAGDPSPERLHWIHDLMAVARARGLECIPEIYRTSEKTSWIENGGRLWELSSWMPGRADFHERPSRARLEACCRALARVHCAWADRGVNAAPCAGIQRRLERAHQWRSLVTSGWVPAFAASELKQVRSSAERAWSLLQIWADRVPALLTPWANRNFPLQPCLCDMWHDHVLFTGDLVRGFIDFGGVKIDHVSVDLARLLGSMVGDDRAVFDLGLESYARIRPLSDEQRALARLLDITGVLIGIENWLRWLYAERKSLDDADAASKRLQALVERVEKWVPLA